MNEILLFPVAILILGLAIGLVVSVLKKGMSGLKAMLLGINITVIGGIMSLDPAVDLAGVQYLIVLTGLIISVIGLMQKD